jgi:uncharacterized protein (DUF58 family)
VTPRSVGIVLAGVALTLIALMFGTAPLFVPGIAFALLGAAAPAWVWVAPRGASVERRLDQRRVVEGEPLEATISVRAARLPLTTREVLEPLAPAVI